MTARPSLPKALSWVGLRVDDVFGVPIGKIADILVGPGRGDEPRWLLIRGGRFGGYHTLVPFDDASVGPENAWVPYERATVRAAPTVARTEVLSPELDDQLEAHYRDARGVPVPSPLTAQPRPRAQHPHRLGGSRTYRRA